MMHRANSIPPTRQAEIKAAFASIDPDEIGAFNANWLRDTTLLYLETGRGFAGQRPSDDDFLEMFELNLKDMRAAAGRVRQIVEAM